MWHNDIILVKKKNGGMTAAQSGIEIVTQWQQRNGVSNGISVKQ